MHCVESRDRELNWTTSFSFHGNVGDVAVFTAIVVACTGRCNAANPIERIQSLFFNAAGNGPEACFHGAKPPHFQNEKGFEKEICEDFCRSGKVCQAMELK
jgi:hypothetical protein